MSEDERHIGRVIIVESDKVIIELDRDAKSLTKSFLTGAYPIARINSYVLIPVGSIGIVGIITRVSMAKEDVELTAEATLALPKPKRTISVTMVGTLSRDSGKLKYSYGIREFPVLDNPVWFILEEELDIIFDRHATTHEKDYFVNIGLSTAYSEYEVKVNPDKLFSRHLGVLGNTGAGKSCTIASVLQSMLGRKEVSDGTGGHFIIFDTNGEYKQAFEKSDYWTTLHIDQSSLNIPYWFMNAKDWVQLAQPKEGSQHPILHKALLYARNPAYQPSAKTFQALRAQVEEVRSHFQNLRKSNASQDIDDSYKHVFTKDERNKKISATIKDIVTGTIGSQQDLSGLKDIDVPVHFDRTYFREDSINNAIDETGAEASRIRSYSETMLQRMDRYFSDPRYEFLFHNFSQDLPNSLALFMRLLFGRMKDSDCPQEEDISKVLGDGDSEYFFLQKYITRYKDNINSNYNVIILDLSLIPSDILQNITAILGRLILEFLQRIEKAEEYVGKDVRGKFPVVLVLEEAHNYIPERLPENKESVSKEVFERIAREGRKYGLSLVVSSQRPSELSRTVLSQCNSYFVHRIQNPEDQEYIRRLLPSISHDLLKQLPVLAQGVCLVFGDCVRAPMQVYIDYPSPAPRSNDPQFWNHWIKPMDDVFPKGEPDFENVCAKWQQGTFIEPIEPTPETDASGFTITKPHTVAPGEDVPPGTMIPHGDH